MSVPELWRLIWKATTFPSVQCHSRRTSSSYVSILSRRDHCPLLERSYSTAMLAGNGLASPRQPANRCQSLQIRSRRPACPARNSQSIQRAKFWCGKSPDQTLRTNAGGQSMHAVRKRKGFAKGMDRRAGTPHITGETGNRPLNAYGLRALYEP
jgi:hypothetical protein